MTSIFGELGIIMKVMQIPVLAIDSDPRVGNAQKINCNKVHVTSFVINEIVAGG